MSISDFIMGIEDYEDVQRWKKMAKYFRSGDAAALSILFMNEICPDQEEGRNCDLCGREAKDLCDLISRVQAAAEMAEGKIGPDADAKPRSPQESDDLKHCHSCGKSIEEVKGNLCKGDYFIGSIFLDPGQEASRFDPPIDASYYFSCCDCARSWQITEERKAALWHAINVLKENDIMEEPEEHLWDEEVTVLQAMMKEAEQ